MAVKKNKLSKTPRVKAKRIHTRFRKRIKEELKKPNNKNGKDYFAVKAKCRICGQIVEASVTDAAEKCPGCDQNKSKLPSKK